MSTKLSRLKESAIRKIIDNILANLGWETDELSPDCNVFTEHAKTEKQSALLEGKEPDYILYESGTDRPIAVVEAKRPRYTLTQAIDEAIEKYAEPLGIDIVFAHDGTLCESFDRKSSGPLFLDDEPVVELLPPELLLQFANDGPSLRTPTKALLQELGERGYGERELSEVAKLIEAENSDIFDVLAYIAFAMEPITRTERVQMYKAQILDGYDEKLHAFLEFVLGQYEVQGVSELDQGKRPSLLELKYSSTADAASQLGGILKIRDAFIGFQRQLYQEGSDVSP